MKNNSSRFVPKDCFSWMNFFLKCYGLNPPETKTLRKLYKILSPPFFLVIFGVPLVCEPLQIMLSDDNVERKLLTVGIFSLHVASIVGITCWLMVRKEFEEVISAIKRPSFQFDIFDFEGFGAGEVNEDEEYRSPISAYQEEVNFRTSLRCSWGYFSFFFYVNLNFFTSYTTNYYQDTNEKFNPYLNRTSLYRDFVYPLWLPFDYSVSDGHYFIAFIYQPVGYYLLVGGYVVVLWMVLDVVMYLKSQVTIIAFALTQVDCNIPKKRDIKTIIIQEMRIVKCIRELQIVIGLAAKLDSLINIMMLLSFLCSLFILCCLSYLASVLSTAFQISLFASIFGATLTEVFFICWFIQEFTSEFSIVTRNIYDLEWTSYSPRLVRMLVFFMARVQKPPTFKLYRWAKIDMLLFINVVKMASSFYTVISNVNTN